MKKITPLLLIAFLGLNILVNAQTPDTIKVTAHNNVNLTWYGNYDKKIVFPSDTITYNKILLHYTMGCATGGCSDWDYTTQIEIMKKTGAFDSTLVNLPNFTVNGNQMDTFYYATSQTFHITYDSINNMLDTVFNSQSMVILYNDSLNPTIATDTLHVWDANYYYYLFDANFNIVDSILVAADSVLYLKPYSIYNVYEVLEPYELARVITPYGNYMTSNANGYNSSWKHTHTFDITDFAPLLKDSVIIRAFYDGWSSGFSVTLNFDMIVGTPPRKVLDIENIYKGSSTYQNTTDFETNFLKPQKIFIPNNVVGAKLRIIPTGHGFDNNVNCGEFCQRNYAVKIFNETKFTQSIWRNDCGMNPIYPQGGTWLLDRANWCPGSRALIYQHEITPWIIPDDSLLVDIDLQNYTWSGNQAPSYYFTTQLMTYRDYNFNIDAGIEDIITPSLGDDYKRFNPACSNPQIILKNYGKSNISSVEINYKIKGNQPDTYTWTGLLEPNESEIVTLPNLSSWNGAENVFEVSISNPNGTSTDENPLNNTMSSPFQQAPTYNTESIILEIKTNTMGLQTSWTVEDANGNVVYSGGNYNANTIYKDTMALSEGCYVLKINDSGKNGLSYWANSEGSGFARLKKNGTPGYYKIFNPDFGTQIIHYFRTSKQTGIDVINDKFDDIKIFPNPTSGELNIVIDPLLADDALIEIFDIIGHRIISGDYKNFVKDNGFLFLENIKQGTYFILIKTKTRTFRKQIIVVR